MNIWNTYTRCFTNRKFLLAFLFALAILIFGIACNYMSSIYATERASNSVTDIILSNIPVFDVDALFTFGPIVMWAGVVYLLLKEPWKMPFTLKSIGLFCVTRSIFVSLTHIGPFPQHAILNFTGMMSIFTTGADLFFSGHTGLPFLLALVFWDSRPLRIAFIACSVFFGVIVLLGHFHYSIDVLSAFFITYSIYHIAEIGFKHDRRFFDEGVQGILGA